MKYIIVFLMALLLGGCHVHSCWGGCAVPQHSRTVVVKKTVEVPRYVRSEYRRPVRTIVIQRRPAQPRVRVVSAPPRVEQTELARVIRKKSCPHGRDRSSGNCRRPDPPGHDKR